jgi:hypothetical protein
MKPDDFALWAEQKGPPFDAGYAMIAWTVRDMPHELREAFLLASEDGARYADVARACGVTEEVARQRVLEAANIVNNGERLIHEIPQVSQPVDADIERMVDYLAGALSDIERARHEHRMRDDGDFFEKVWSFTDIWGGAEDLRDLIARIDEDRPPRPTANRELYVATRKLLAVVQRRQKRSKEVEELLALTSSDCRTLLKFALAGDERIPMYVLSELAAIECLRSSEATQRWRDALSRLRFEGEGNAEDVAALMDAFQGAETAGNNS